MTTEIASNFDDAFRTGVLVENPNHIEDQRWVLRFIGLIGGPSRPIDEVVVPRSEDEFSHLMKKLPSGFFDPFNRLLHQVQLPSISVAPDKGAISSWNNDSFVDNLVVAVESRLDDHVSPRLIPLLVLVFRNLEWEQKPTDADWPDIDIIAVPGSRTYDRAAEAFRAYVATCGRAALVTLGSAPYWDKTNSDISLTEAEANAAYLRLLGVPSDRIYPEMRSSDTVENADFLVGVVKQIIQTTAISQPKVLLVTSPFHVARYRLNVEMSFEAADTEATVLAIGSKASRYYWAETYFLTDPKSHYDRQRTMRIVFNEYLKIAFDLCATKRSLEMKEHAPRTT